MIKIIKIPEVTYNYFPEVVLPNTEDKALVLGKEFAGVAVIMGLPGSGKSTAIKSFNGDLIPLGENIQWKGIVGPPANISNLTTSLSQCEQQVIVIDSITTLRMDKTRLGRRGLDLAIFDIIAELSYLAYANGIIIFIVYNPIQPDLVPDALNEAKARSSLVIHIENRKCSITDPLTREFEYTCSNNELYDFLFKRAITKPRHTAGSIT